MFRCPHDPDCRAGSVGAGSRHHQRPDLIIKAAISPQSTPEEIAILTVVKAGLAHELKTLSLMFSPQDLIKLMGPNTAAFIDKSNELGTLEAGKLADIVMLDGNPLEGYWNLLNARVVIKGGNIVVDKR